MCLVTMKMVQIVQNSFSPPHPMFGVCHLIHQCVKCRAVFGRCLDIDSLKITNGCNLSPTLSTHTDLGHFFSMF